MRQTPIQRRIELSVTGGLGYDSQTDFSKTYSIYSDGITPEEIKNTDIGLKTHLREISYTGHKLHAKDVGYIFSYSGRMMPIKNMNRFRHSLMENENQDMIDRAYSIKARKLGRLKTLKRGIMRKTLIGKLTNIVEDI